MSTHILETDFKFNDEGSESHIREKTVDGHSTVKMLSFHCKNEWL
jgi:hypothetical protein